MGTVGTVGTIGAVGTLGTIGATPLAAGAIGAETVDCLWTEFQYTECSNPCGGGTMVGTRYIFRPAQYGGKSCSGPSEVNATCNSDPEGGMAFFLKTL